MSAEIVQDLFEFDEPGEHSIGFACMGVLEEFVREDTAHPEAAWAKDILTEAVANEERRGWLDGQLRERSLVDTRVRLADAFPRRIDDGFEVGQQTEAAEHPGEQLCTGCGVGDDAEPVAATTKVIEEDSPAGYIVDAVDIGPAVGVGEGCRQRVRAVESEIGECRANHAGDIDFLAARRLMRVPHIAGDEQGHGTGDVGPRRPHPRRQRFFEDMGEIGGERLEADQRVPKVKEHGADGHGGSVRRERRAARPAGALSVD